MARTMIWPLAILLVSAMGLPNPAAAVTFEFTQTSSTPPDVGAGVTLILDNAAFWDGINVERGTTIGNSPPFDLLGTGMSR